MLPSKPPPVRLKRKPKRKPKRKRSSSPTPTSPKKQKTATPTQSVVVPVVKSQVQSVVKPQVKLEVKSVVKPVIKSVVKPVKPEVKLPVKPAVKSVVKPVVKPKVLSTVKQAVKSVVKPVVKSKSTPKYSTRSSSHFRTPSQSRPQTRSLPRVRSEPRQPAVADPRPSQKRRSAIVPIRPYVYRGGRPRKRLPKTLSFLCQNKARSFSRKGNLFSLNYASEFGGTSLKPYLQRRRQHSLTPRNYAMKAPKSAQHSVVEPLSPGVRVCPRTLQTDIRSARAHRRSSYSSRRQILLQDEDPLGQNKLNEQDEGGAEICKIAIPIAFESSSESSSTVCQLLYSVMCFLKG
jgi:hypothetical protein